MSPVSPLPGAQSQGWTGKAFLSPAGMNACRTAAHPSAPAPGSCQSSLAKGHCRRGTSIGKRLPGSLSPPGPVGHAWWAAPQPGEGGRPGCAARAGHQASPPFLAERSPRPRHKLEPERQPSRRWDWPDKFPARLRAAGGGRQEASQAAPGPRCLRASPLRSCAPGGDRGAPRRAAGGRLGDAEPRRSDRRDSTGPPEVSGARRGRVAAHPCGGPATRATEQAGHPSLREGRAALGCRVRVGSPPASRRTWSPRPGTARPQVTSPWRVPSPRVLSPTWRPQKQLLLSFGEKKTERVSAGGEGARGSVTGRCM